MSGDCGALTECKVKTLMCSFLLGLSWNRSVYLDIDQHGVPREGS